MKKIWGNDLTEKLFPEALQIPVEFPVKQNDFCLTEFKNMLNKSKNTITSLQKTVNAEFI